MDAVAACDPESLCRRARYHGVLPLVAERLGGAPGVPAALASRLKAVARSELAADMIREQEITAALSALASAGIGALLLKGVHLAYAWYPRPDLRPRMDTDLLVPPGSRAGVDEVLRGLGYERLRQATGELLTYQAPYEKRRDGVAVHLIDVHWRIANPQPFGGVLVYDELASAAVPVAALGPAARGLSAVDALLLACVHRVAHHHDSDRLIWLYDIHVIAAQLGAAAWGRFLDLAARRMVAGVCQRSLEQAVRRFQTAIPAWVRADPRLRAAPAEPTAAYLRPRRHVHRVLDDLTALPTWRDRVQLVREHLFPSRRYMREVYDVTSRAPLPLLYARRAWRGARRWLERGVPDNDAARIR